MLTKLGKNDARNRSITAIPALVIKISSFVGLINRITQLLPCIYDSTRLAGSEISTPDLSLNNPSLKFDD